MTSGSRGEVLLVDDEPAMVETLERGLVRRGFRVRGCSTAQGALQRLAAKEIDVLVTDMQMPDVGGIELCRRVLAVRPGLPVVVLTAFGSLDSAVEAMRAGAYDFVTKPVEVDVLAMALDRAIEHRRLHDEVRRLREVAVGPHGVGELIGESSAMTRIFELLDQVAASDTTVLVTGESGTGKELVARALHERSTRRAGPFVAVNCAAVSETLLESELFGHVRGAFTDARSDHVGLLQRAHGGVLLLDEVGEMAPGMQAKLLRALQERKVRPVGGHAEAPFDARIIASTNRDLATDVAEGRFREDLYFRLNVIAIEMPPLRARGNDVLLIAQRMLERFAAREGKPLRGIAPEAARKLLAYRWPGNVRELMNCMERAVALARYDHITVEDLPERVTAERPTNAAAEHSPGELVSLDEVERSHILRVLDAVGGSRTEAARILGVDRKTLYRKLERWAKSKSPHD